MKTLRNVIFLAITVIAGWSAANAQTANNKKAAKETAIKNDVETRHYTFIANYAQPLRGGEKMLTAVYYDLRITPDSLISFLPYYGQAYFDIPYNPTDGGIKFTSTKFDYIVKEKKKSGWEITISPKDVKDIERLILYISRDGYASLSVMSTNKDFISFNGYLKK